MRIGELQLDDANLELRHRQSMVRMSPKPFSLLQSLAERVGRVVPRQELISSLWPGQAVGDEALGSAVRQVRRALSALSVSETIRVEVVRGRGYRLSTEATRKAPEIRRPLVDKPRKRAFVGRAAELATLEGALARAGAGGPRIVAVSGPAGIGKTRLSTEFAAIASERGYRTFWGRCIEGQSIGFSVWADLLRDFAGSKDRAFVQGILRAVAPELSRALPSLRALAPEPDAELSTDPQLAHLALVDGFVGLLERIAEHRACVYVLEDLHWADPASLRLLHTLATQRSADRVFVVATYRDDEPEPPRSIHGMFSELERLNAAERLWLAPLSGGDSERLLDALGSRLASAAREEEILRIAGGNPFFLEELYRHATESADDRELPEHVERLVLRRLESLSPSARSVVEGASVLGFQFEAHRAATLSGDDGSGLDELVTAGLVQPSRGRGRYRFTHALHQHAVYSSIPPIRRARLHLQVATELESHAGPSVNDAYALAEIAHHYDCAAEIGPVAKAYRYRVLAGEEAARRFAYEEAVLHLVRATELLECPPAPTEDSIATDEERCDLWSDLARVARLSDYGATCERALKVAIPLARKLDDPARLALGITSATFVAWEDPALIALHEEALARLDPERVLLRAVLLSSLAQRLASTAGAASRRRALAAEALEITASSDHKRARHYVLEACSIALPDFEPAPERALWADEMIAIARSERSPFGENQGHVYKWAVDLNRGRLPEAMGQLEAVEEITRRHPWPRMRLSLGAMRPVPPLLDGRLEAAEEYTFESAELVAKFDDAQPTLGVGLQIAMLRREQGRLSELRGAIDGMTKRAPGLGWIEDLLAAELGDREALTRVLRATFEGGGGSLRHGSSVVRDMGMFWLAELCERWSDPTFAEEIGRELEPTRGSWPIIGAAGVGTRGSVHRAFGLLEMLRDRPAQAVAELETAARSHEQPGARLLRLWTNLDLGRALVRRGKAGDRDRAERLFDETEQGASRHGLVLLGERLAAFRAA